jgi:hypothetical protein
MDSVSFQLHFRNGDSLAALSFGSRPLSVTETFRSDCPNVPPQVERQTRAIAPYFGASLRGESPADWSVDVRRTAGGGYSGTARYHRRSEQEGAVSDVTRTLTFGFEWEGGPVRAMAPTVGPRPPAAPAASSGRYTNGRITFTQGGQEAQWALWRAEQQGAAGTEMLTLTYTPSGQPGRSHAALAILRQGGTATLVGLRVQGGPAGDATYAPRSGGCTLSLTPGAGGALDGSVTCTSGFRGTPITRLTFRATP